jgi:hypothetical protein
VSDQLLDDRFQEILRFTQDDKVWGRSWWMAWVGAFPG